MKTTDKMSFPPFFKESTSHNGGVPFIDSTNRDQSIAIVYQNQINLQTAIATSQVFSVEVFPNPAGKPREVTEIHIIKIKTEKNSSKSGFFLK